MQLIRQANYIYYIKVETQSKSKLVFNYCLILCHLSNLILG